MYFDGARTLDKTCRLIEDAGRGGANLVVFPEALVPGYPVWAWFIPPGCSDGFWVGVEAVAGVESCAEKC